MARVSFEFKKGDLFWVSLVVVLLCVGFGVAYNSGVEPSVMGHSSEEIELLDCEVEQVLEKISDGWQCSDIKDLDDEIIVRKAACSALMGHGRFGGLYDVNPGKNCAETCNEEGTNSPICHRAFSTAISGYTKDCDEIHPGYPPVYCCCSYDGSVGRVPDYYW